MELGVEWAWRLFWKMGPLITLGAEEEPSGVPCVSPSHPTFPHTQSTDAPTLQGGSPEWTTCTLILAANPGSLQPPPAQGQGCRHH